MQQWFMAANGPCSPVVHDGTHPCVGDWTGHISTWGGDLSCQRGMRACSREQDKVCCIHLLPGLSVPLYIRTYIRIWDGRGTLLCLAELKWRDLRAIHLEDSKVNRMFWPCTHIGLATAKESLHGQSILFIWHDLFANLPISVQHTFFVCVHTLMVVRCFVM